MPHPFSPARLQDEKHEPYLQVFVLGFGVILLTILPVMILTGGYFVYYGDFNSQQLPFYALAHEAARNGDFGWNWKTDLGANFIGSYSFYLLGSPFFWLTYPFPQSAVPYLIPWLLALKHGVAAITSYAYIRRFVRSREASMVGALLYTYSGFQIYNIFFNHFQDVTAFFPLMLLALEQLVNEDSKGGFALSVALMATINYYFFTGQAVFVLLYFLLRCPCKDFRASWKKFFAVAFEAILGVMMAAFMLLPSALAILDNERTKSHLYGLDLVTYSDRTRIWHILQSFFMLPDAPARPNLFRTDYAKWASIGGYLPMFSMAGVLAFCGKKKGHWATRLCAVCTVCAFIPVLNSAFYMFNASYYARWFYMPILIMAMMTAYALDAPRIKWRGGLTISLIFMLGCGVISLLPRKDENGETIWFDFAEYTWYFFVVLAVCLLMLFLAAFVLHKKKTGQAFRNTALWLTALSCLISVVTEVYFGIGLGSNPKTYIDTAIEGGDEIHLESEQDQFYRVDISKDYDNYPMFWGYSNMRCFHSIVPPSIMDFYDHMDITRDVASRAETSEYPLRALFNVKYYFDRAYPDKAEEYSYELDMPGFRYLKKENGFYIYENEAYIPMGVAYDRYIGTDDLELLAPLSKEKALLKGVGLDEEQIRKYRDILKPLSDSERTSLTEANFVDYCQARAEDTCDTFRYDSYGFDATITLEKPQLVFFSVPYESGWTAQVNGKPVDVERVSYGFMAVRCEAGANEITFQYRTPGLAVGAVISLFGVSALIVYLIWAGVRKRQKRTAGYAVKYHYDYFNGQDLPPHDLYLRYAQNRRKLDEPVSPKEGTVRYEDEGDDRGDGSESEE